MRITKFGNGKRPLQKIKALKKCSGLHRNGSELKSRCTIRPTSKVKDCWTILYEEKKLKDDSLQTCRVCGETSMKEFMDAHHPFGRINEMLLAYHWVHSECHRLIHAHKPLAIKLRLIGSNY